MNKEIQALQFELNVSYPLVTEAIEKYGSTVCYRLLEMVKKRRRDGDLGRDNATGLFRNLLRNEADDLKRQAVMEERARSREEMVQQWEEAQAKGYVPTKETIGRQLQEMYNAGQITEREFQAGARGMDWLFDEVLV